ncbi:MAG TPA: MBL fold metallo-hydrolase [Steroidobacteraceae bacterium]|jgi:glyoxylase-like metal-dependent hydrolase (beta-lactamase superfamily II)
MSSPQQHRFRRAIIRAVLGVLVASLVCAVLGALFAPYVYEELTAILSRRETLDPAPAKLGKGRMFDDYFAVQDLGDRTYAIGEPRYWQENYSYLIVGDERAILFDAGSGTRNMRKVIEALTTLPLTVMVSHLHYDHLGGIGAFDGITLIDLPETRADVHDGRLTPSRYEYSGILEGRSQPRPPVSGWVKPGASIDLGGRTLTVMYTPGHTENSMALFDAKNHRLFIGDFVYPGPLYAFLPGASLSTYEKVTRRLLQNLPQDTVLFTAHCCRKGELPAAPWLDMQNLKDLKNTLDRIEDGSATSHGFYPRIYAIDDEMTLDAGFPWNNR